MPIQTYSSYSKFPAIGARNVTYLAKDTGHEYEFNQGYKLTKGAPKSINNIPPKPSGNLPLTATDVKAISDTATITINSETKNLSTNPSFTIIDGSGTANELTYWVDVDTLGSLTTATYPSLTELSYVKGVTRSIQDQLGYTAYITIGNQTTTSNVASDITGLAISLEANKRYRVYGVIRLGCNNTGGVNFAATIPTASTMNLSIFGFTTSVTAFIFRLLSVSGTLGGAYNTINSPAGFLYVLGEVETGANAGNLQMQFASGVNTQTSTIFQLGTWLNATEL